MRMTPRRLAVIAFGAVVIAWVWLLGARHELAHDLLVERARDAGFTLASFDVTSIGISQATVENILVLPAPGQAGIEAQRVVAHYDLATLWNGRISRLDITGVRLSEAAEVADPTQREDESSDVDSAIVSPMRATNASRHPFDEISIQDAQYRFETAVGEVVLKTNASSSLTSEQVIEFEIEIDVEAGVDPEPVEARARLRGSLAEDGSLHVGPLDCLEIDAPKIYADLQLRLDSPLSLCIRGAEGGALQFDDVWRDPSSLRVSLGLDRTRISGEYGAFDDSTPFDLDVSRIDVHVDATDSASDAGIRVASNSIQLRLPAQSMAIEDAAFELAFDVGPSLEIVANTKSVTIAIGRLVDIAETPRFPPLRGSGTLRASGDRAIFEFDVGDTHEVIRSRVTGHHDRSSKAGELTLQVEPLHLGSMGERLVSLFPVLLDGVTTDEGTVRILGNASWREAETPAEIGVELELELDDVTFASETGTLEGVNAKISISGPEPWMMSEPQRITVERLVAGQELTNAVIDFQLLEDGTIDFPKVDWEIAGGLASTRGRYDPQSTSRDFEIKLAEISLRKLLAMVDFEGLEGKGTLAGAFPVHIEGDEIWIRNAELTSTPEGGKLRYRPSAAAAGAASSNEQLEWVTDLLEDFRFSELVIVLNGLVSGDVKAAIHLEGSNPEFQDGVPIEYNLNVDASYADLFAGMALPFEMIEELSQRVKEGKAGNAGDAVKEKRGNSEPTSVESRQSPEAAGSLDAPEAAR